MNDERVISIDGIICPTEADVAFNDWYDEEYIPANLKFKGILNITRAKLIRGTAGGAVKDYPQYLTTFRFADIAAFQKWNASPEFSGSVKNWSNITGKGVRLAWRAQFEVLKKWQNTAPHLTITVVSTVVPAKGDARFDSWYTDKHVPDLLKYKPMEGATRYRLVGAASPNAKFDFELKEYPKYLTYYCFADVPAAEGYDTSPERDIATQDWLKIVKETGVDRVWRAQYIPTRTWQR